MPGAIHETIIINFSKPGLISDGKGSGVHRLTTPELGATGDIELFLRQDEADSLSVQGEKCLGMEGGGSKIILSDQAGKSG